MSRGKFAAHSIRLVTPGGVGVPTSPVLPAKGLNAPTNTETETDGSGSREVQSRTISSVAPQITGSTKSIDRFLEIVPADGICVDDTTPGSPLLGVEAYYERKKTRKSGSVTSNSHVSRVITDGLMVPLRLTASSRKEAVMIEFECDGFTDGVNRSMSGNNAATLPTFGSDDRYEYRFGAIQVAGLVADDATSFTLDFGVRKLEADLDANGGIEPDNGGTAGYDPSLTVSGTDLTAFSEVADGIGLDGRGAEHSDTTVWLRRKPKRGEPFAVTDPVHARFTISGLATWDDTGAASGDGEATNSLMVKSETDSTNAVLIFQWDIPYAPGF